MAGFFFFVILTFGQVAGSEFAPDGFRRRNFYFYQIPFLELQITPVFRSDSSNNLEEHLKLKKIVSSSKTARRWDSVLVTTGSVVSEGDAWILSNYLDTTDAKGNLVWLTWTKSAENNQKFKPFWAAVHRAAELKAYFMIPDLFGVAVDSPNSDQFQLKIDSVMVANLTAAGDDYASIGDHQRANELYSVAVELEPANKGLIEKQSQAQQFIEKTRATTAIEE